MDTDNQQNLEICFPQIIVNGALQNTCVHK